MLCLTLFLETSQNPREVSLSPSLPWRHSFITCPALSLEGREVTEEAKKNLFKQALPSSLQFISIKLCPSVSKHVSVIIHKNIPSCLCLNSYEISHALWNLIEFTWFSLVILSHVLGISVRNNAMNEKQYFVPYNVIIHKHISFQTNCS